MMLLLQVTSGVGTAPVAELAIVPFGKYMHCHNMDLHADYQHIYIAFNEGADTFVNSGSARFVARGWQRSLVLVVINTVNAVTSTTWL